MINYKQIIIHDCINYTLVHAAVFIHMVQKEGEGSTVSAQGQRIISDTMFLMYVTV